MPTEHVVLFDGHCRFCTAQSQRLLRMARPGALRLVDFQQPGALDSFSGVTHEQCMEAMHLVSPDGRVHRGVDAIVQALATRRLFFMAPWIYHIPGIKQLLDWIYQKIAERRYRLGATCKNGACKLPGK